MADTDPKNTPKKPPSDAGEAKRKPSQKAEFGGREGPEPTRYGDWEKNGLISDF